MKFVTPWAKKAMFGRFFLYIYFPFYDPWWSNLWKWKKMKKVGEKMWKKKKWKESDEGKKKKKPLKQ
jgi:hypothetical protein